MKIAITADLHLMTKSRNPERYRGFENVLEAMLEKQIDHLVLAGDTFDASGRNYAEFEEICQRGKYKNIQINILPGNHDVDLNTKSMSSSNVEIITKPVIRNLDEHTLPILFLPYHKHSTMGGFIAEKKSDLPAGKWILLSHGDWIEGLHEPNPFEPGVYMPLTRSDLETYRPALTVLGHIHKPYNAENVYYTGSPCGLDIRETGRRRFLIVDLETASVESVPVASDFIYFNETFIVLPVADEREFLQQKIENRIQGWQLSVEEKTKARLQIRLMGFTSDKNELQKTVKNCFKDFQFYKEGKPDLSQVSLADNENLTEIIQRVSAKIQHLSPDLKYFPDVEAIYMHALQTIYGGKVARTD